MAIYLSEIELRDLVIVIYDRPIGLYYEFRLETITCRLVCCSLVSSIVVEVEAEWLPEFIQW